MLANQMTNSFKEIKILFEQSIRNRLFNYRIPEFVLR